MNLDELRLTIDNFSKKVAAEYLQHALGKKEELEVAPIYEKYGDIFTKENALLVKKEYIEEVDVMKKRALRYLYDSMMGKYMGNTLAPLGDEYSTFVTKSEVTVEDKTFKYKAMSNLITNEKSQEKRKIMYDACSQVREKSKQYSENILKEEIKLIEEFGYPNEVVMLTELHETNYEEFVKKMLRILKETKIPFDNLWNKLVPLSNLDPKSVFSFDAGYMMKSHEFDTFFPEDKMRDLVTTFVKKLGFELGDNIKLHLEKDDLKDSRAFCYPVDVPNEVHLVVNPVGGKDDYRALWHEMGHTLHFANSKQTLPYEFKYYGLNSTSETYAFLFEHLFHDANFLRKFSSLSEDKIKEFLEKARFHNLLMLRRYCAKLIYELKFYKEDLRKLDDEFEPLQETYEDKGDMYVDILSKATNMKYFPVSYILDFDSGLYSAEYLKAWIFEPQLRDHLKKEYGDLWFEKEDAGNFLRKMFSSAQKYYPEELAKHIGDLGLDESHLIREFENV
jgi:oligoendopeptidase F